MMIKGVINMCLNLVYAVVKDKFVSFIFVFLVCILVINNLETDIKPTDQDFTNQHSSDKDENLVYKKEDISFDVLNVTGKTTKQTVFFNRLQKVGSSALLHLIKVLSHRNKFHTSRFQKIKEIYTLSTEQQRKLATWIDSLPSPYVYTRHVMYINFIQFHLRQPIYVNIVRDPVEKAISWYYYMRRKKVNSYQKKNLTVTGKKTKQWLQKSFGDCVQNGDAECSYHNGAIDPYHTHMIEPFCGNEPECRVFDSRVALMKAKENVDRHYAVVGLLEDMNSTLTVLDYYVPRFFKNALEYYTKKKLTFKNRNDLKEFVSDEVKNHVRKNFTVQIEFYEFCKQRLYRQYEALNILY